MSSVKEEKRQASNSRMLRAALREFALMGFRGARIEKMAKDAEVSKGLYPQRFQSKENLYLEVFRGQIHADAFLKPGDESFQVILGRMITSLKVLAKEDFPAFAFFCNFFHSKDIPPCCEEFFSNWFYDTGLEDLIRKDIAAGRLMNEEPIEAFKTLLSVLCGIIQCYISVKADMPSDIELMRLAGYRLTHFDISGQDASEVINLLASDYNAIYYCDADSHDYDIVYQQGFVREELLATLKALPKYEDAFASYVKHLVHPDDQAMMSAELGCFEDKLKNAKGFTTEFRRRYGRQFLYTQMKCVKVGKAEDVLHHFVVGFVENDSSYKGLMEQQRQLELAVTERTTELQEKNRALNRINEDIVELLGNITEARDIESGEHIRRVKGFTNILARQVMNDWPEYNLSPEFIELMTSASALHDIGKITIPDAILLKPGKLTKEEFDIMKSHCDKGSEMLKKAPADWSESYKRLGMDICRYHHEKYDGKGYPEGLAGDAIPIAAQIVSVADCFDALTTKRVYKPAYSIEKAFEMIIGGECGAFSDKLLSSFNACRRELEEHARDAHSVYFSSLSAGLGSASLCWAKILYADGDKVSRSLGVDILKSEGAQVEEASSASEAIEKFVSSADGFFDVVLIDCSLPEMSAREMAEIIRSMDRGDAKRVVLIGLYSGFVGDSDDLCMKGDLDSRISKPVAVSSLNKILYECIQSRSEILGDAVKRADRTALERLDNTLFENQALMGYGGDLDFAFYVNGNTNDVSAYRCNKVFEKIMDGISHRLPSNKRIDWMFRSIVPQMHFENFLEDTNRKRILTYLENHSSYHALVPAVVDGKECLYRLRVVSDKSFPGSFLIGLQSIDAETREELRAQELIRKLSEDYEIVDYIDLEADSFSRYRGRKSDVLGDIRGGVYSDHVREYVENCVFSPDRSLVEEVLNIDSLRKELHEKRRISLKYRTLSEDGPRFVEMKLLNAGKHASSEKKGEVTNVILTVLDINEEVRRERENNARILEAQRKLMESEQASFVDPLTGVKNIAAYTDIVAKLSERLASGQESEFAVAMFDVNSLKDVNIALGYEQGDGLLKHCCSIICDTFKHSPVYRIGGDEFSVILIGKDYRNRQALAEAVNKMGADPVLAAAGIDRRGFAWGMAEFDSVSDSSVADVVKRADLHLMLDKKKLRDK